MKNNKSGFTLIELIVSLSILSIVMISIFTIFQISAELNNKIDISRSMQENIKNIVETISEDVRKLGIKGVSNDSTSSCSLPTNPSLYNSGIILCTGNVSYYLAKKNTDGSWLKISNNSDCNETNQCFIVKKDSDITPLSNSWVDFKSLNFYVSNYGSNKVTLNFELQPSGVKGINPALIKENKIILQTTISERLYRDY